MLFTLKNQVVKLNQYSHLLKKLVIRDYFFLTFFSILMFMPGIMNLPVIERDEAHFAQASRQMVQTGNYFQIRFQEITRFQKPPGINWLQAGFVNVLSDGRASVIWPYRLPSFFGAWLSVILTYFFSRRFVGERVALLSASFLASSLLLVVEAHMAVIDAALLFSVVTMQGALWIVFSKGTQLEHVSKVWGWIFWLAMALGFVLKGVTPLVGFLSIVTLSCITRRMDWLRSLCLISGGLLFLVLTLAWVFYVNSAEQSNYLMQMIHHDLLPKLQGGHESHGKPPLFHLVLLPLTFWPASLFLWPAGVYAYQHRQDTVVQFLLAWILPTWAFFEIMPTKLPQYVLPTFPAVAILCALAVVNAAPVTKTLRVLQCLWGILSIGLAIALLLLSSVLLKEVTLWSVSIGVALSLLSGVSVYLAWHNKFLKAACTVLLIAAIVFPMVFSGLLPELKPLWLSKTIAEQVRRFTPSATKPIFVSGRYAEPGLVFYLNTSNVVFSGSDIASLQRCAEAKSFVLMGEDEWLSLFEHQGIRHEIITFQGYNYTKGQWVRLVFINCEGR